MTGFKITAFAVSGTGKGGFRVEWHSFIRLLKNMSSSVSSKTRYWVLALAAIVLDQWSKWAVLSSFQYRERVNVIPSFFDLTLVYNPGAAFSFLADQGGWQKYFFFGAGGGGERVFGTRHLARRVCSPRQNRAAMIIGGASGNVIDRLIHGHVVDFLLFYWQNWFYPAFNIADSFICVGAVLAVLDNIVHRKDSKKNVNAV
ncbi:signal peptidase II [Neisseria gonorrhoeae]|uniref:signal peptidase II n=1 Tax=Neisseria gonorrhoeae TaxID=485 RepID=UPI001431D79C|nr:signal peptidase II [Neisseria gonorrhoeae]